MDDFSVQISSNLVDRLTAEDEKLNKKTKRTKTRVPRQAQKPQTRVDEEKTSYDSEQRKGNVDADWSVQPPLFLPFTQPSYPASSELDAIRAVLKQSESVVEKLRKQEENMVHELTQKAKDLHDKEFKIPDPKPMPCLAENNAWRACYKENANDLTKCASLAENFADCARRVRQLANVIEK